MPLAVIAWYLFAGGSVGWPWDQPTVPGVVCSRWAADDRQTGRLMVALYGELLRGRPAAEALRAANLRLLADGLPPLSRAPFVLQGG